MSATSSNRSSVACVAAFCAIRYMTWSWPCSGEKTTQPWKRSEGGRFSSTKASVWSESPGMAGAVPVRPGRAQAPGRWPGRKGGLVAGHVGSTAPQEITVFMPSPTDISSSITSRTGT